MYAVHKKSGTPYKVLEFLGGYVRLQGVYQLVQRDISYDSYKKNYELVDEENLPVQTQDLAREVIEESKTVNEKPVKSKRKKKTVIRVPAEETKKKKKKVKVKIKNVKPTKPKSTRSVRSNNNGNDMEGPVTLGRLAEEAGIEAKKARQILRGKIDKPGTKWEWPEGHKDIEKVRGLLG